MVARRRAAGRTAHRPVPTDGAVMCRLYDRRWRWGTSRRRAWVGRGGEGSVREMMPLSARLVCGINRAGWIKRAYTCARRVTIVLREPILVSGWANRRRKQGKNAMDPVWGADLRIVSPKAIYRVHARCICNT